MEKKQLYLQEHLFRMYTMYAEKKHWKLEVVNENETGLGGYKEVSL